MQHKNLKSALVKTFALVSLFLTALTFTAKAGGDLYEIYLNNKLILKQFVTLPLNLKNLPLDKGNVNDELIVYYSHCGTPGQGRKISLKDEKGKIIKEWKFADVVGNKAGMRIPVKELLQALKTNQDVDLIYAAKELPAGLLLTSLRNASKGITSYYRNLISYLI